MIKATRSFIRPNTTTPFYEGLQQYHNYCENVYVSTGKRISTQVRYSPDGLTQTREVTWTNQAGLTEFNNDPRIVAFHYEPRDAHNQANGIQSTEQVVTDI
jgi:hypothetical protein